MKRLLLGLMILFLSLASSGFEVKIVEELGPTAFIRWPVSSIPISYVVDSAGTSDISASRSLAAIQSSFDSWQSVSKQFLRFTFAGTRTPATLNCSDRVNSLLWVEQNWSHSSFVLAVTRTTFFTQNPPEFVDSDIIFNGVHFKWSDEKDKEHILIQSVARHEIGHMIGFEHSQVKGATMLPFDTNALALSSDEKAGIRFLYPASSEANFKTLSPPGGSRIVDETSSSFPPITFRWTGPAGFSNFVVEFSRFNTFTPASKVRSFAAANALFLTETAAIRKKIRKLGAQNRKIFWRVRADSATGQQVSKTAAFFLEEL